MARAGGFTRGSTLQEALADLKKRASKMVHRKIVTSPRFKISNAMSPIEAAEHKIEIDRKRSQLEWWWRVKEVLR